MRVVAVADEGETHRNGLLQSAVDEVLARTRAVANLVGSVGGGALGAMPEPDELGPTSLRWVPAQVCSELTRFRQTTP
jgi:hypothetical protein